jgi:hypothetical protein
MCKIMEESNRRAIMDIIFSLISKGRINPEEGAEELNMPVAELLLEMEKAGYKTPAME